MRKRTRSNRPTLAIFGTTAIPRLYCPSCEHTALVIQGKMACCDRPADPDPEVWTRESEPPPGRAYISPEERERIVASQGGLCIYCGLWFGSIVIKDRREIVLKPEMDHLIPFCFDGNSNVLASCQICNQIKFSRIFRTLDEARSMISLRREELGYYP